jgi:hypothetical protein
MKDLPKISAAIPLGGGRLEIFEVKVERELHKDKSKRFALSWDVVLCTKMNSMQRTSQDLGNSVFWDGEVQK